MHHQAMKALWFSPPVFFLAASLAALCPRSAQAVNVTDGLIHLWHLDEPGGTVAADSIGSWDFTLLNGATPGVTGIAGNGVRLDGINDFLKSSAQSGSFLTSDFTVSLWARWSGVAFKPGIFTFEGTWEIPNYVGTSNVAVDLSYAAIEPWVYSSPGDGTWTSIRASKSIADDQWHLITLVREGDETSLYVDALMMGAAAGRLPVQTQTIFKLGSYDSHLFGGTMDEVAIYDRALSAAEVASNVPEPGGGALLVSAAGLLGVRRRRSGG